MAKYVKESIVGSGGVWVWREFGVWGQAFGFVIVSLAVKEILHYISFIRTCYEFCTFKSKRKDIDGIIFLLLFNINSFIPVNFDGAYNTSIAIKLLSKVSG